MTNLLHNPNHFTLGSNHFKAVIYIASPYSLGDKQANVDVQRRMAHQLLDVGYCPIAPLLSHYLEELRPREWSEWLQMDFELIRRSDALLRLSGESKGADMEVIFATQLGKPIFYSIYGLLEDGMDTKHMDNTASSTKNSTTVEISLNQIDILEKIKKAKLPQFAKKMARRILALCVEKNSGRLWFNALALRTLRKTVLLKEAYDTLSKLQREGIITWQHKENGDAIVEFRGWVN